MPKLVSLVTDIFPIFSSNRTIIDSLRYYYFQECGAHREVHHLWNADPIQDYLRRQAFFQLYEMGLKISYSLNRTPSVREDNFDVGPWLLIFSKLLAANVEISLHLTRS